MEIFMTDYIKTEPGSIYLPRKGSVDGTGNMNEHGSVTLSWINNLTGVTNPNWRKLVEGGRNATTPMSAEEIVVFNTPASYSTWYSVVANSKNPDYQRYKDCSWSLDQGLASISVDSIDAQALNAAQTKWNAKIFDVMTSFQGGVFLGELKQTLNLIAHPGMSLRKLLRDYLLFRVNKRGKLTRQQRLRHLAQSWLEFMYGVKPLLSDIEAATKYLQTYEEKLKRELVRVSGSSGDLWGTVSRSHGSHLTYGSFAWDITSKRGASARYSGAIKSEAVSTFVKVLDQTGFSPRNWAPTLYEIIPWSFVIDYFSNMGSIIEAWSNQSLSLAWGSLTTKQFAVKTMDSFVEVPVSGAATVWRVSSDPGLYHSQRKRVFRSIVTTIPVPDISFKIPGFDTKWINIAALVLARKQF
jgi:hypothetical protein